ncbi:UDP-N-acetylmuramate dehydrogenase [Pseudoglutamicibacter cumminsii]|uniref:UDP-N-acetylmuramate dehydrogenase n=1 Tax=Pseudoglutamicibacter cumminsii TaxID=156979 RepID=UPI0021A2C32E|nr:UDP-N-acetylmuramate dehydrogenase [Pseudoglutamicibacter cumminsii]MCT1686908.1 UDP-N-acetylmuramate dehydrogenase [Pseudoglutamicibacter cumminsii]
MSQQVQQSQQQGQQQLSDITRLSDITTMGVGGPADRFIVARTREEILEAVQEADAAGTPLLIVGGGSNLVIADEGYRGTVLQIATRGITMGDIAEGEDAAAAGGAVDGTVPVTIEAGHPWDEAVAWTVEHELGGLEALSGIPGAAGATPVQNVGAYGADVSNTLISIEAWDRHEGRLVTMQASEQDLTYRNSVLKRATQNGSPRWVVLAVTFGLKRGEALPVAYDQLARALNVELGTRVSLADVREAVLGLRRSKGMVVDPQDPDTNSCGSFFMNPIVEESLTSALPADAPRYPAGKDGHVKLSAAWLIDHAGYHKGFGMKGQPGEEIAGGRASLSSKHTLAVTNQGGASCADVVALARAVRAGVKDAWGIELHHEPLLIGTSLDA